VQHSKIAPRGTGLGQKQNAPFLGLRQLPPAPDITNTGRQPPTESSTEAAFRWEDLRDVFGSY
jgi:hypothetical protein